MHRNPSLLLADFFPFLVSSIAVSQYVLRVSCFGQTLHVAMVTKVIVYSFLYGVVYCTTARENINETRVKIKLDRGGRIHKGSFIFV